MKTVDELIQAYVNPLLRDECENLKIPLSFVKGVYGCYSKPFEYDGYVERIEIDGKLTGVRIRIGDSFTDNPRGVLETFFHEMYHAKEIYEEEILRKRRNWISKLFSELKAELYARKRISKF